MLTQLGEPGLERFPLGGEQNGFDIRSTDIISDNATTGVPFTFSETAEANGSGLLSSFTVYDSLGSPIVVSVTKPGITTRFSSTFAIPTC